MRKVIYFFGLLVITYAIVHFCGWFVPKQEVSIAVFATFIYGTLMFGEFRLAFAFGGIAALLAGNLMSVEQFILSASLDVIVFLIGTFLVIGFLEENQFFEHLVAAMVKWVGPRPQLLLAAMMFMGSISSCLVGEVTAILFMAGTLLHLTSKYKLNPVPFVIMLVFACNIGSAMSSVGNPIGVLIALKTGLSFIDFLKWAAPIALVVNGVVYFICRWWYAESFAQFGEAVKQQYADSTARASESFEDESDTMGMEVNPQWLSWVVLLSLIALLVTHGLTERWLGHLFGAVRERLPNGTVIYGLKEGTMMVAAALIMGCVVLLIRRERARELVERRVDWWTLAFFMMLFASVGTLQDTGVTRKIAEKVQANFHDPAVLVQVVGWATGWLSAFLDNVLAVATFMPVVHDIRVNAGQPFSSSIYWMMLFGGTFMGNMTIIGSTANIVACGLLEKRGHGVVRFGYWFKIGFIVSIASMLVAAGLLWVMDKTIGIPMLLPPGSEVVAPIHT